MSAAVPATSVRRSQKTGTPGSGSLLITRSVGAKQGSECHAIVPGYYGHNPLPLGFHRCPAGTTCDRQ